MVNKNDGKYPIFFHDKQNYFEDDSYDYYRLDQNEEGWYEIRKLSEYGMKWQDTHYLVPVEELQKSYPRTFVLLELMVELSNTNCGCCDAPWVHDDTIASLVTIMKNLEDVTTGCKLEPELLGDTNDKK